MRYRTFAVAILVFALAYAGPAFSLSGDTIERWVSAMQELEQWGESQGADLEDELGPMDPEGMNFERVMHRMASQNSDVQRIVRSHGFGGADDWADVSGRIFNAYMALKMEESAPEMERQMEQALRQMENNPNIPEEQKAMMRQQMEQQRQMMTGFTRDVSEEDLAAVRSRQARLDAFFDDEP